MKVHELVKNFSVSHRPFLPENPRNYLVVTTKTSTWRGTGGTRFVDMNATPENLALCLHLKTLQDLSYFNEVNFESPDDEQEGLVLFKDGKRDILHLAMGDMVLSLLGGPPVCHGDEYVWSLLWKRLYGLYETLIGIDPDGDELAPSMMEVSEVSIRFFDENGTEHTIDFSDEVRTELAKWRAKNKV